MYRTQGNVATHLDPWAAVLRLGLYHATERVIDVEDHGFESQPFNSLTTEQRVVMLATVGKALLVEGEPAPELTAVVESTAWIIIRAFEEQLIMEAESDGWRDLHEDEEPIVECRAAALGLLSPGWDAEQLGALPELNCDEWERWQSVFEGYYEEILWDDDFELEEEFGDAPPEVAGILKNSLDIPDEYFLTLAPEPTAAQYDQHLATLEQLTGLKLRG